MLKYFVERIVENRKTFYIGDDGNRYTMHQMAEMAGMKYNTICARCRAAKLPVAVGHILMSSLKPRGRHADLTKAEVSGFDRGTYCHRDKSECVNYSRCLDAMIDDTWVEPTEDCFISPDDIAKDTWEQINPE